MSHQKKIELQIHGMHCASCEVLVEQKFKQIPGVERVRVNHATGRAEVSVSAEPPLESFRKSLHGHGYDVSLRQEHVTPAAVHRKTPEEYAEIGVMFVIVVAGYLFLQKLNIIPQGFGVGAGMGYGIVFLIGLAASVSTCMAVTGGLVVAAAAKYAETHPRTSGIERLRPHLIFNAGRVASYTIFGALVGALGSVVALSPLGLGAITIAASVVMIILGFQLLKLFPSLGRFTPRMPKALAHRIHEATSADRPLGPFLLGASTFFLPCGFTQALQLYVLSTGSATIGGLTMLVFSLGTLPALFSLSAVSSFATGTFRHYFLRFAGVVVIVLGVWNINSGIVIAGGTPFSFERLFPARTLTGRPSGAVARIENGVQIVDMKVTGYAYSPGYFTVQKGVPVEWRIDGRSAAGCARVITMPAKGITRYLNPTAPTVITFTPDRTGQLAFNCSMGMTSPYDAAFTVVDKEQTPQI